MSNNTSESVVKRGRKSFSAAAITAVLLAALILSVSIAVPILFRPFYYSEINKYKLDSSNGLTKEEVKTAYNEMLDFCIGKSDEFSTGILKWSEEGKAHFEDCRKLFLLDFKVAGVCAVLLLAIFILKKKGAIDFAKFKGRGPFFFAGAGLLSVSVVTAAIASIDFDRTFVVFHSIFFKGKDNWIFDWYEDQIIRILPQDFFMDCAILIAVIAIGLCIVAIVTDAVIKRKSSGIIR